MAVLAAEQERTWWGKPRDIISVPLKAAAGKIYKGGLVMVVEATGLAEPAADTASTWCVGIAQDTVDNSAGAASALSVPVAMSGVVDMNTSGSSVLAAWVGLDVYITDDNHVDLVGTTSNDIKVGKCVGIISTTKIWVLLNPFT
jgi:hypothetical protein